MKHLFIPYELALLAKEKGFDEPCFGFFKYKNKTVVLFQDKLCDPSCNSDIKNDDFIEATAPLYQQLIDWFREKHNIQIHSTLRIPKEAIKAAEGKLKHLDFKYAFYIYMEEKNPRIIGKDYRSNDYYEALNQTIKEAFKLI